MTYFFVLQARRRAGRVVNRKLSINLTPTTVSSLYLQPNIPVSLDQLLKFVQ
jgi:hypothetical protein